MASLYCKMDGKRIHERLQDDPHEDEEYSKVAIGRLLQGGFLCDHCGMPLESAEYCYLIGHYAHPGQKDFYERECFDNYQVEYYPQRDDINISVLSKTAFGADWQGFTRVCRLADLTPYDVEMLSASDSNDPACILITIQLYSSEETTLELARNAT